MKTSQLILQQIQFLRVCWRKSAEASATYAGAKNEFENADAAAGNRLISGEPLYNDTGEPLKLTNDIARKAYVKDQALIQSQILNVAKEDKETAAKRVDVEVSVLSALKQIAVDEDFEDEILARYDLLTEEEAGI